MDAPFHITLVVGLGNPGPRYTHTHHNLGFMAIDYLAKSLGQKPGLFKKTALFEYTKTDSFILVRPRTFMNDSGPAVRAAVHHFLKKKSGLKGNFDQLLVIHDDSDIPVAKTKLVFGRGAAGHHGVSSIIQALGTKNFWRFRIGIRKNTRRAGEFVLAPIAKKDQESFQSEFRGLKEKLIEKEKVC